MTPGTPENQNELPIPSSKNAFTKQLPKDATLVNFRNADPGWFVYYQFPDENVVVGMSISFWVYWEFDYTDEDQPLDLNGGHQASETIRQEIRPSVVTSAGTVVDFREIPGEVIVVLGPTTKDHTATVIKHCAVHGLEVNANKIHVDQNEPGEN